MGSARAGPTSGAVGIAVALGLSACLVPAALAWPGRPSAPPPKPPAAGAPPPAWIESQARSAWLAFGSSCWTGGTTGVCINMIPPEQRPGLPVFTVKRGAHVRVHLRFAASSVDVSVDKKHVTTRLDGAHRIISWQARHGGILTVFAKKSGDASYVTRLKLR